MLTTIILSSCVNDKPVVVNEHLIGLETIEDYSPGNEINLYKTYFDYLTSNDKIETESSVNIGSYLTKWNVNDLYYYLDDFNNDGIIDLAISVEMFDGNGIEIYTYKNGQVEKLLTKHMPYSPGTEIFTLAKFDEVYGIKYFRDNSLGGFTFSQIDKNGNIETILCGSIYDIEGKALDTSDTFDKIIPIKFYNIEGITSLLTTTIADEDFSWQYYYAKLLRKSEGVFLLCDIDGNEIPELLIGDTANNNKYSEYDLYNFINGDVKFLDTISTISSSNFQLDNYGGILCYDYGAGGGGTHRFNIKNNNLYNDGEVYGYYFDDAGNQIEWFLDSLGNEIIVTEESLEEYNNIWQNAIELHFTEITEENISNIVYNEEFAKPSFNSIPSRQVTGEIIEYNQVEKVLQFSEIFTLGKTLEDEKLKDIVRASFDDKEEFDLFVKEYLTEREMYKEEPDKVYGYGDYFADYYVDESRERFSLILYENIHHYFVTCVTFSSNDLSDLGNIVYGYNNKHELIYSEVFLPDDSGIAYTNYNYIDNIPFPIVDSFYIDDPEYMYGDLISILFHINQRLWLDSEYLVLDENDHILEFNADLYNRYNHYSEKPAINNNFVYSDNGNLIAIQESFSDDNLNDGVWEYATDINLYYKNDGSLNKVEYGFYYMDFDTHDRGSGDSTGTIYYDEQERIVHRDYYMTHGSHSCFYLYEENSKTPWAYIDTGGLAWSGDDISEYGFGISVYIFQNTLE